MSRIWRTAWLGWAALVAAPAGADVTTDGSFGPAGPIAPVGNEYRILDSYGRYSDGGGNLFHSLGRLNIGTGQIASFSAENGTPVRIIARITGGASTVDGTLRTVGGAIGADLFLLNPRGLAFGPNARLDVQGSLHLSTAQRLHFENDPQSAFDTNSSAPDPPLSVEKPSAFGFLSGAEPAEIRFVQVGRTFQLPEGETFSAVGGSLTLRGANFGSARKAIRVPLGRIQLAAVDGPVDVPVEDVGALTGETLAAAVGEDSAAIRINNGFNLDVSADAPSSKASGRIVIRGGALEIDNSEVSAVHLSDLDDTGPVLDVEVVRDASFLSGGKLKTWSSSLGRSGGSTLVARSALIDGAGSGIESLSADAGEGGATYLRVGDLVLKNGGRLFSDSTAGGTGGRIEIHAARLEATSGGQVLSFASGSGAGGAILIYADRVFVSNQADVVNPAAIASVVAEGAAGKGGDLTVEARVLEVVEGGGVSTRTEGSGAGGNLAVLGAESVVIDGMDAVAPLPNRAALTAFTTLGSTGAGGSLNVASNTVDVLNGGQISTNAQGEGDAGPLTIQDAQRVSVRGGANGPSFISSDSRLVEGAQAPPGASGRIGITALLVELVNGGRVTASTDGTRDAGSVRIEAHDVVISGVDPTAKQNPSVVLARSNAISEEGGDGGGIEIVASGDVTVSDEGGIESSTAAGGDAGTIDVSAQGSVRLERLARVAARTEGGSSGNGGSVRLTAKDGISISENSLVATEALGSGLAGDIVIDAGPSLVVADSAITTEAADNSGGNITIVADQIVHLQSSELTTSVLKGVGGGGDISIDPQFVVLDQSRIVAQAIAGVGGNISISAGAFFQTSDSEVSASSERGIDGTVSINAPDSDVTSGITTLPSDVLDATALMRTACSAATAEAGSFVVSGRHPGLPVHPDGLLTAFDTVGGPGAVAKPGPASQAAARVAIAGPYPAHACSRALEEVL